MIIVDASVICAIMLGEPDRGRLLEVLTRDPDPLISPVNRWEALVSLERRFGDGTATSVELLFARSNIRVAGLAAAEAEAAFDAWRNFGKGRHPAGLNLGDCFAYALAKSRDLPLLFKGDDFAKTDVRSAM
mgnify:CR=1 FL=1